MTYFPSQLPVQYYGLPDGKVYIVYGRFYDVGYDKSGVEYVFAVHQEFSYNYEDGEIIPNNSSIKKFVFDNSILDNPNPKFYVTRVYRKIKSFSEAYNVLNKKAFKLLNKLNRTREYRLRRKLEPKINLRTA